MLRVPFGVSQFSLTFFSNRTFFSLNKFIYNQQLFSIFTSINQERTLCNLFSYDTQSLISAVSSSSSISSCKTFHARIFKSLNYEDGFIGDRLVSVYTKLGFFEYAWNLFDEMPKKDLVSWNSLISGFSRKGELNYCLNSFHRMRFEMGLEPNEVSLICIISACTERAAFCEGNYIHGLAIKTGLIVEIKVVNSLINMYGKLGYLDMARQLFDAMPKPNLVSWNSIIIVLVQHGVFNEALEVFKVMRRIDVKPDQATMVSLLQGCGDIGVMKLAEVIHGYMLSAGLDENITIATSVLSVYAKSGRLDASCALFREMKNPDRIAWTAMIGGYAMHGYGREAIMCFDELIKIGMKPDHVTFTHLLSACSHSGLVKEGKRYFEIMSSVYGVEPRLDHYSCMVDLLGRSACLKDAYELIKRMPMEPNHGVWGALLNACRINKNVELGKEVAERLFTLDPSDRRNYVMLSSIYAAARQWKDASKVRALMKEREVARTPGCSFIEHRNMIHGFVVGDRSHPEISRIYIKLEELIRKIQNVGYKPNTEYVLHDVDDGVKEDMVKNHSEKLAIAFGLLVTEEGLPLVITKNLRICGDCHNMAKFVSLTEDRVIIIRDVKRFHHFAGGLCSCGDYW
ncbi:pentatricopeptide repeat-containing protein At5g40410, mitochondrial [Olea europaea var. sylvestris]|uniref:pentatricopeptide repeat-containing protein At5g40410, mitochondrial n=1 Tax=Olea europaea var. sylvestris TaxID=158386 RepID=UPI000C1D673F|nr:pentatricopeptide repeat-containing protein At5g40410, mitochondrial [Olea europaea var. sylvestris]